MKGKAKRIILNGIIPIVDQVLRLVIGLVVSKLVLEGFGSEYNGLIHSTTHIMSYLCLLEAGISASTRISLFSAFANNDKDKVSAIYSSARYYYRRVCYVYLLVVLGIGFIYPLAVKSSIDYWVIFGVIVMQGASGALGFAFNVNFAQLFISDGKSYITNLVSMLVYLLCNIGKVISVLVFDNIFAMLAFNLIATIIQTIVYFVIYKKNYKWIKLSKTYDKSLLPNRGSYLIMQLGALLFSATDTIVLSIFCGFKVASVYAVYMIAYGAITQVASTLRSNFQYVVGQGYNKYKDNFMPKFDAYQNGINTITTCILAVAYVLIIPFVSLYTAKMTDINYINKLLPIFFTFNILLDDWNYPDNLLMKIIGKAKKLSIFEVFIGVLNLGLSLILVNYLGIEGVLIGTLVAVTVKNLYLTYEINKKCLHVSIFHDFIRNSGNLILLLITMVITNYIELPINNFGDFIVWGLIITPISIIIFIFVNTLINFKIYKPILNKVFSKIKNKKENIDKIGEVTEKDIAVLKEANNLIKDQESDDISKLDINKNNEKL